MHSRECLCVCIYVSIFMHTAAAAVRDSEPLCQVIGCVFHSLPPPSLPYLHFNILHLKPEPDERILILGVACAAVSCY